METRKTKIVLDADVIIHFIKADCFALLPEIFPEYEYLILDVVYNEIAKHTETKKFIDNYIHYIPKIKIEVFSPEGTSVKEFFQLQRTLGKGESACMVYCRDHCDVLGSSNLKDIKDYCIQNNITYLTTVDFLYYAYCRKKLSEQGVKRLCKKSTREAVSYLSLISLNTYVLCHFEMHIPLLW